MAAKKKKKASAKHPKSRRVPLPPSVELEVVLRTRRRCPFCFGLQGDTRIQQGQIAHLDQDNTNVAQANLMFMCLTHHDQYDTKTRQSKGLSQAEAEAYQAELVEYLRVQQSAGWMDASDNRSLARLKTPTRGVSLALHQARLPIYQAVMAFIAAVTTNAKVEIADLRELWEKTDGALFMFGPATADFITETYRQGVRLRLAGQRLEHASQAHQPLTDKMIDEEYNLLNWFIGRVEAWRQHVHPFLQLRNDAN
jgi:hypothetical protein